MKALLCIAALLLALSCRAQNFYQFNRYSTNFDTTLINGINMTNISGTNLVVGSVNSNKFDPPTLALLGSGGSAPTVTFTNFLGGVIYTNSAGRMQHVSLQAALQPAAVGGSLLWELYMDPAGGQTFTIIDLAGEITSGATVPNIFYATLRGFIPPAATFVFTNLSSGAGNSVIVTPSSGIRAQF